MRNHSLIINSIIVSIIVWVSLPEKTTGFTSVDHSPNVIIILADDQGSVDAGCYGTTDLQTPALDDLARRGIRFTQFYAAAPVCSPSRASLLTGRYPLRVGLTTNTNASDPPIGGRHSVPSRGLPGTEVTLAEMFKAAGYETAMIGKWHLGHSEGMTPHAQGFDHFFGFLGACLDNYSHFFYWRGPNRHDLWRNGKEVYYDGQFFPELMIREAGQFMEENRTRPFFLYFAVNMPHYPYQGNEKWPRHYKNLPCPRRLYAAFLSTLDDNIGRLLAQVDRLGLRDNTIIVYQSDNGHSTEERAFFGGGSSGPYRGAKFSLFEGGIRSPAVIAWPGHLPQGKKRSQLAHSCDWMPTLAELTGVELLDPHIDGKSLVSVLRHNEEPTPHQGTLHWQVGQGKKAQWAVRAQNWKLIGNILDTSEWSRGFKLSRADKKLFLANLAEDVGETHNYAAEHPDVVERLRALHRQWLNRIREERSSAQHPEPQRLDK